MKKTIITLTVLLASVNIIAQDEISLKDIKILDNTSWEGSLTYKDYQDGKQVTIPTTMQFKVTDEEIISTLQYTYEPSRNITSKTKIKKNGRYFGKEEVVSKIFNEDGSFKIVTKYEGKDDNKKALIFLTYQLESNKYSVTKEVQFLGTKERFVRNKYQYTKL